MLVWEWGCVVGVNLIPTQLSLEGIVGHSVWRGMRLNWVSVKCHFGIPCRVNIHHHCVQCMCSCVHCGSLHSFSFCDKHRWVVWNPPSLPQLSSSLFSFLPSPSSFLHLLSSFFYFSVFPPPSTLLLLLPLSILPPSTMSCPFSLLHLPCHLSPFSLGCTPNSFLFFLFLLLFPF